jgi:hypothetical protein
MALFPLGLLSQGGGAGGGAGAYELIETVAGTGSSNSITFSSIPQTYKHLQIRFAGVGATDAYQTYRLRFNGDTSANYARHALFGQNGSVQVGPASDVDFIKASPEGTGLTTQPSAGIFEILDYQNTNKFKTGRFFSGAFHSSGYYSDVGVVSGLWRSTSAITSITFYVFSASFATSTRVSLYGIKG